MSGKFGFSEQEATLQSDARKIQCMALVRMIPSFTHIRMSLGIGKYCRLIG